MKHFLYNLENRWESYARIAMLHVFLSPISNLVGKWATWEHFRELERAGLMMYGQMTAGSWIYIGTQGILQGTYETFAAAGQQHFGTDLLGKLVVSSGLGGMGGAQPLAATMNNATFLGFDVDAQRIQRRVETRYLDEMAQSIDEGIDKALLYKEQNIARSIGVVANAADALERMIERGIVPDMLTDQTSAHDPVRGYVPRGVQIEDRDALIAQNEDEYITVPKKPWRIMFVRCFACKKWDRSYLTMETTCVRVRKNEAYKMHLIFRFCSCIHSSTVLRRKGSIPMGGSFRRSTRHLCNRSGDSRSLSRR